MSAEPSVIAALEAAVAASPDDAALRRHLAWLLLEAGQPKEALEHCRRALALSPDDTQGLALAARAAEAAQRAEVVPAEEELVSEAQIDEFLGRVLSDDAGDSAQSQVSLADVGGLDEVKRRLRSSFLAPLQHPELRALYGKSLRGGLLLYGPPGCGKTFLARAVAGELGARFLSVGLHDVLDMWLGQSERNLHGLFQAARRAAPCVLFLDEADALGQKRAHLARSAARNVVAQLLAELDGFADENEGLFLLGATNQPWDLDPALRRPGRFDRMLLVLPPDREARVAILAYHLRDRPVGGLDLARVAERTEGYSGADLRLLCEAAAERAIEDSLARDEARAIGPDDFEHALRTTSPSTRPWFETARNYALFANEGGAFDDLLAYMRARKLT